MNVRVDPKVAGQTIGVTSLPAPSAVVMPILLAIASVHMINDAIQALLPAMYPLFKDSLALSFTQVGILALVFQTAASLLQPVVGALTDLRPMPFSLPIGMVCSMIGVVLLSRAGSFEVLIFRRADDRHRQLHLPPRGLPRGAFRRRRPLRLRAGGIPGRRPRRLGDRAIAGGVHRGAAWAGERRLVPA